MSEAISHRVGYGDALKLTTSLCLSYTILVAGLRAWVRRGMFGLDDTIISAATIICLGHFAANYAALALGVGKPWHLIAQDDIASLNQTSIASVATFVLALYASKAAVVAFLSRISQHRQHVLLYWTCTGLIVASGLVSVFVVTVNWPLGSGYYWAFYLNQNSCDIQTTRWAVFTALDLLTELMLLILPVHLLWGVHMKPIEKVKILTAFFLRLPVIGFSIGRTIYTDMMCSKSTDIGKNSAIVIIFLEVEASYAIVSSTFSALKAFTSNFNSSFGFGFTQHAGAEDYSLSRMKKYGKGSTAGVDSRPNPSHTPAYNASLKSQKVVTRNTEIPIESRGGSLSQDRGHNTTRIHASPMPSVYNENQWQDSTSDGSTDGVIMRHTEYSVRHSDMNDERPILNESALPDARPR